jgi:Mu-like prophage major head subunit gpT
MPDGFPLFDSTNHKNVTATATTLDAAALGAGRTLLRRQTALGGGYLSLVPAFLIVPPELETTAEMLLASGSRTATATRDAENPEWISRLTLVVEPRLPTGNVYLATSPTQIDTVELGLLEENVNGPVLDTREGFDIDMREYKARHTFGVQALDYRGMVKMPISAVGLLAEEPESRPEPQETPVLRSGRKT